MAPFSLELERAMMVSRLDAAKRRSCAQGIDRIIGAGPAELGIVAAGSMYGELRRPLGRLGLRSDADLAASGIRLYKPAMIWPLEPSSLRRFAEGLREIVVVEEKRSFIESQIRDLLYGHADTPAVHGKRDDRGELFASHGGLVADDLVAPLRRRLEVFLPADRLASERARIPLITAELPGRTAHFCSGCPHNRSTVIPEGSVAHGGIGCHSMSLYMERGVHGVTHMGGEGAQWVGMSPFVDDTHRFQYLGDGTLAHSGSLAIRQAVSAGTTITYKILYNGTVAMTGGQDAAGNIEVPALTHWLAAEGVDTTVVVSDDPKRYTEPMAKGVRVEHRDQLDAVQRELREIEGVTVLIYDQGCAAELRRDRKRGLVATPTTRVVINEAICEGCGDCGEVSNCASVHPVQTPFGRKTQIHQESCNYDLTCLNGNCPAFVTIEIDPDAPPTTPRRGGSPARVADGELPPEPAIPDSADVLLIGIGGTGVVTVSQVLATAAMLDGKHSNGLDQTGLAQKGGPVVSNVRITADDPASADTSGASASNRVDTADAMLVFDLVAASKNLDRASEDRTRAIISTGLIPTGAMVSGRGDETFPALERFRSVVEAATLDSLWLDTAGIARRQWSSQPAANVLVLGLAYQQGLLPVSSASLERAIELNGVAVATNLEAFRLGRRIAADPSLLEALDVDDATVAVPPPLDSMAADLGVDPALSDILAWRIPELIEWQDAAYAESYVAKIREVRTLEAGLVGSRTELSQAVARHLYKFMAYKDEYEVARLALRFDQESSGIAGSMSYQLKPPTMKAVGYDKKVAVPEAAGRAMFKGILRTKKLRGTRLDPFGRTEERRTERALIGEYTELVDLLLGDLTADSYERAVEIASLADMVRGFDTVKLANVRRYRAAVAERLARP
ncbi:MAG: indolepyruvate ferredoxin oxidoreductase family protein [Acidimicrobiales bacterium]